MKKTDLQCAIATTPKTIAKMGRDENVSLERFVSIFSVTLETIVLMSRK